MSCANQTGVTQKGQNMEISFGWVHFLIFLKKKTKYKKRRMGQTTRAVWCRVTEREERGGNGELTD
jgi:hypothetical protein